MTDPWCEIDRSGGKSVGGGVSANLFIEYGNDKNICISQRLM